MDIQAITLTLNVETVTSIIIAAISIFAVPVGVWKYNSGQLKNKIDKADFNDLSDKVELKMDCKKFEAFETKTTNYIDHEINEVKEIAKEHRDRTSQQFDQIQLSLSKIYTLIATNNKS